MADAAALDPDTTSIAAQGAALQHRPWRSRGGLSSMLAGFERFLAAAGFDRAPWLAVSFALGIAAWLMLDNAWQWLGLLAACLGAFAGGVLLSRIRPDLPYLAQALASVAIMVASGLAVIWLKSALAGAAPIERPVVASISGTVLDREPRPAEQRTRLLLLTREPGSGRAIRVRVTLPSAQDRVALAEGAQVRIRARLMPPAPPMLPGGYDFARTAWFAGLSATGSALGPVEIISPAIGGGLLARMQAGLADHVRERLTGSPGAIAAALVSGDRGAIAEADETAMRDSGLTHLLSISGLHVSAVVAAAYFLALRVLALWPWLALRVRLPLAAAGIGALTGVFYTLLTGAEVPTVRSCIGAVLVLAALALGREPLSMRMVAMAAFIVMLFWPEAVAGPSFQMSFVAVIAIVSLHGSAPVRAFLAPREEGWAMRMGRNLTMLLATGVVIELAIMPIGLFHFHRAGAYGAFANVIAIPLTTIVSMPLIALSLLLDLAGAGGPVWWLAGQSIEALLALARWVASRPGAVTLLPAMGAETIALFVVGGLWLALWRGRVRLLGLVPAAIAALSLLFLRPPDVLVSGDGRHVGITGIGDGELLVLRDARSGFVRDNLTELAGMNGRMTPLARWPDAQCSEDFCAVEVWRGGRNWHLLIGRSRDRVDERALVAACERVDIVIADRWLPRSCRPRWLKADRRFLARSGGLAIDLNTGRVNTVAETQGEHGWWRGADPQPPYRRRLPIRPGATSAPNLADQ